MLSSRFTIAIRLESKKDGRSRLAGTTCEVDLAQLRSPFVSGGQEPRLMIVSLLCCRSSSLSHSLKLRRRSRSPLSMWPRRLPPTAYHRVSFCMWFRNNSSGLCRFNSTECLFVDTRSFPTIKCPPLVSASECGSRRGIESEILLICR